MKVKADRNDLIKPNINKMTRKFVKRPFVQIRTYQKNLSTSYVTNNDYVNTG